MPLFWILFTRHVYSYSLYYFSFVTLYNELCCSHCVIFFFVKEIWFGWGCTHPHTCVYIVHACLYGKCSLTTHHYSYTNQKVLGYCTVFRLALLSIMIIITVFDFPFIFGISVFFYFNILILIVFNHVRCKNKTYLSAYNQHGQYLFIKQG